MGLFISFITISLILVAIAIIAAKLHIIEGIITPAFWVASATMLLAFGFLSGYILDSLHPSTTVTAAVLYFFNAVACGFMVLVSYWIEDDEKALIFKFASLLSLLLAAIFASVAASF